MVLTMSEFVSICEVGPRDGLQIAKTRMTTDDKVALDRLDRCRRRQGDRGRQLRPAAGDPATGGYARGRGAGLAVLPV